MKIEALTRSGQLALCRRVERLCGLRLRSLRRFADPQDKPLHKVLDERIADWDVQLRALERLARGAAEPAEDAELAGFLRERFPSHRNGFGEGPIHRDVALYLAECVEDERSRFYHELAGAARDGDARALFQQFADRDAAHLKFLRSVLLYSE
ncbi:MAG TPA: hypothetical protein VF950_03310 [Planctomycetota bacterium]